MTTLSKLGLLIYAAGIATGVALTYIVALVALVFLWPWYAGRLERN